MDWVQVMLVAAENKGLHPTFPKRWAGPGLIVPEHQWARPEKPDLKRLFTEIDGCNGIICRIFSTDVKFATQCWFTASVC